MRMLSGSIGELEWLGVVLCLVGVTTALASVLGTFLVGDLTGDPAGVTTALASVLGAFLTGDPSVG